MEHTYNQFRPDTGEHRLCPRELNEAHESLQSADQMQKNPNIKESMSLYEDAHMKREFPELLSPLDRAMFFSLLLDGQIRNQKKGYPKLERKDMNVADPLHLEAKKDAPESIVRTLQESLPKEQFDALKGKDDAETAANYMQRVERTEQRWNAGKVPTDELVLRMPLYHYRAVKKRVDTVLRQNTIMVPGTEERPGDAATQRRLSRDEYLVLLKAAWDNPASLEAKVNALKTTPAVKQWASTQGDKEYKHVRRLYTDFSAVEVGPEEALSRFGIDIGKQVRFVYTTQFVDNNLRRKPGDPEQPVEVATEWEVLPDGPQKARAFLLNNGMAATPANQRFLEALDYYFPQDPLAGKEVTPADLPGFTNETNTALTKLEQILSAFDEGEPGLEIWGDLSTAFQTYLAAAKVERSALLKIGTAVNNPRLVELESAIASRQGEYEYWAKRANQPLIKPDMSKKDVQATLHLIVQSLGEREHRVRSSFQQREKAKKEVTWAQNLEEGFGNIWEYMKEFSDHPIGSAAMWLMAFMVVKQIRKFVKGETNNFVKSGFWLGIGGLAAGLYQQHSGGEAWWEKVWDKKKEWFNKESKLPPEEQNIPNFWAQKLQNEQGKNPELTTERERLCISILMPQSIGKVLKWHRQKRTSAPGTRVPLPFSIDYRLKQKFGVRTTPQQIEDLMYLSVQRILQNRGKHAKQELLPFNIPNELGDNEEDIGSEYLTQRYVERKYFTMIIQALLRTMEVKKGPKVVQTDPPPSPAELDKLIKSGALNDMPDKVKATLNEYLAYYRAECVLSERKDFPMWVLLDEEASPEIQRRKNIHAGEAAGTLEAGAKSTKGYLEALYWIRWGVPEYLRAPIAERIDEIIKLSNGAIVVGPNVRGTSLSIYAPTGLTGLGELYPLPLSFNEFAAMEPAKAIERWKQHAFTEKCKELKGNAATKDIYDLLNPTRVAASDTVQFGNAGYAFYTNWPMPLMDFLKEEKKLETFDRVLKADPKLQLTAKFVGADAARQIEIRARAVPGGYPEQFDIATIRGESYEQVEKRWLQIQATRIEQEVKALPELNVAYPDFVYTYDAIKQEVVWGGKDNISDRTIKSSLYDMVKYSSKELYERYHAWVKAGKDPAVNPF